MTSSLINPGNLRFCGDISDGYSLEVTAKAIPALSAAAARMAPGSRVFIPYLAGEDSDARLAAAAAVRRLGFEPVPHLSARRIRSLAELESLVGRAVSEAAAECCFVVAGDPSTAQGPFADSAALIETGVFERAGIQWIGVAGHPQGHPLMSTAEQWEVLAGKCRSIVAHGMRPLIVTQFAFDADLVLAWLQALRERDIGHPVRIGVPGPAGVAALVRYAALCGVSASASMWSKYGITLGQLLRTAGPDLFIQRLVNGLTEAHGTVSLHFFPFGGIEKSLEWIARYRTRR